MSKVTRAQATKVLAAVRKCTGNPEAALYEPGFHASSWVVALEGDYDWPMYATVALRDDFPALFLEPVNGWALGIYPA